MDRNKLSFYIRTIGDVTAGIGGLIGIVFVLANIRNVDMGVALLYGGVVILISATPYILGNGLAEIIDLLVEIRYELKEKNNTEKIQIEE